MVRVPYGHLELRLSDSRGNPYLATAAVICAGLDGIDRKLAPGKPQNFNHYNYSLDEIRRLGIGILPQSLKEAINALEADTLFSQQLGSEFIQEFIEVKNMEWVEYERHVSRWEIERYLEYF